MSTCIEVGSVRGDYDPEGILTVMNLIPVIGKRDIMNQNETSDHYDHRFILRIVKELTKIRRR